MTVVIDLQIAYEGKVKIPEDQQFQQWVESALNQQGQTQLISQDNSMETDLVDCDVEVTIRLVDEKESAELNSTYRSKSGPTNVLSFPFEAPVPMTTRLLGDLIVCVPVVNREALEQNKVVDHHWAHLIVHGCLHLMGYDHIEDEHAQEMEAMEVTILQSLAIKDPYQLR